MLQRALGFYRLTDDGPVLLTAVVASTETRA
jgi:hypothetical protein